MAEKPNLYPEVNGLPPHPVLEVYRSCQKDDRELSEQLRVARLSPEPEREEERDLDYVVELYGFSPVLKTKDLAADLKSHFSTDEFRLKWVDDTHALTIFNSSILAQQATRTTFPRFNARMLALGSDQSKAVGRKVAEDMRPSLITGELQSRPKTTAMVARRFVCNALGVRVSVSKEQKEKEERDLMEAKVAVSVSRKQRQKEMREKEGEEKEEQKEKDGNDKDKEGEKEKEGERERKEIEEKETMEREERRSTEREQEEEKDDHKGKEGIKLQEVAVSAGLEDLVQSKDITESRAVSKEVGEPMKPLAVKRELKPRPKITAMAAHRLVCNALGVDRNVSREQRRKNGMEAKDHKRRDDHEM